MKDSNLTLLFLVSSGGFIGTFLRFLVYTHNPLTSAVGFGLSTLFVNILGSCLIGSFYALSLYSFQHPLLVVIMTGVLGGFTTFSAFSLDAIVLLREQRFLNASLYILLMVASGLLACGFGFFLTKQFIK